MAKFEMDTEFVRKLAEILEETHLGEIELADGSESEVTARITKSIPQRARVIALEVDGDTIPSAGLAKWIGQAENDAVASLVFLIGGSYGLPRSVSDAAFATGGAATECARQ